MSSSLSLSEGLSVQDKVMDVVRSVPQGAHYHADAINLLLQLGIKEGAKCKWFSEFELRKKSFTDTPSRFSNNGVTAAGNNMPSFN